MAGRGCDICPAYGSYEGQIWECTQCGDKLRWDGDHWIPVER